MDLGREMSRFAEENYPSFSDSFTFPATKDDIVAQARRKHLPEDVVERLEKIGERTYGNVSDLVAAVVSDRSESGES